ncbi:MAG TPA: YihY family inner membrane protein [Casimicrobiaceae bacterium]|jgi:membrane protein|nr:YihY family inner membrane protein [Casimicrobiaceae bacterium]
MLSPVRAFVSFLRRLWRRLTGVDLTRTAASLAFTTLLGLVPLFTVAFAYVSRFPLFDRFQSALEGLLVRSFLPSSGLAVRHYLNEFVAKSADLKGLSIVFVVVTAVLLVAQVDDEINTIWGARAPRSLARRVFIYVLGLTAGPVLIGAAVYFTNWAIEQSVATTSIGHETIDWLRQPLFLTVDWLAFTVIYAFVPARRVPFRLALVGGVLAALAFEVAKWGFTFYITHVQTYQMVYGTLAALPLFLVWIYVSWAIVLVGAAITATLAESADGEAARKPALLAESKPPS